MLLSCLIGRCHTTLSSGRAKFRVKIKLENTQLDQTLFHYHGYIFYCFVHIIY